MNNTFHHDLTDLPDVQKEAFKAAHSDAEYSYGSFKKDVLLVLKNKYGVDTNSGDKAISIAANGGRRKADVVAAVQYRRYHQFLSTSIHRYDEGICFFSKSGEQIVNYPKHHSRNLTSKHKNTNQWFKPVARVLKNLRGKLIDEKMITKGIAPSYYLEGLLYNVPDDKFTTSYADCFVNSINWIQDADRSKFVCANEQYFLLCENSPVTWRASKCDEFIAAAVELWNQW